MRVVAVSRVLDEVDVIEPFLRHSAALVDHHIVLDNGSRDGTVEVMRALREEGLALEVYQSVSPVFLEQVYNTGLYRLALQAGADWVVFLDADELLVVRGGERAEDVLGLVPEGILCVRMWLYRYARPAPGAGEHPFEALRSRGAVAEAPKVAVRRADPARISVYAGNHFAFVEGKEEAGLAQDRMHLAHVPDRSVLQLARKTILGRLKPMASGQAAAEHFSVHRVPSFEQLRRAPREWLEQRAVAAEGEVEDPVAYLGGALRYTPAADDLARLLAGFCNQGEALARSYGEIMDRKRLIRREVQARGSEARRLF